MSSDDYSKESIICRKYNLPDILENYKLIKTLIQRKVYSYRHRDKKRFDKYITLNDISLYHNYVVNLYYYGDYYCQDTSHRYYSINHLHKMQVKELTEINLTELNECMKTSEIPIALTDKDNRGKPSAMSKLLVNTIQPSAQISYNDIIDLLIKNEPVCQYCNKVCWLFLQTNEYKDTRLTFDAINPLLGHTADNICICCVKCNSQKGLN